MKRLEVSLRPSAQDDIERLETWLALQGTGPATLDAYIERLLARCAVIGDAPGAGKPRNDLRPGLRTVVFEKRVLIAYRVTESGVEIVNLFSQGRDYEAFYLDDDKRG